MSVLPTPWPADPVEGETGHFEHTNWVKASLIALDDGMIPKPGGSVPAGKLLATTGTNTWDAVDPTSVGGVPHGVIVAFHGSPVPTGWALCDGTNGTPDLRGKFILASSGSYPVGSSGGAPRVTLSADESGVPEHVHDTDPTTMSHSHFVRYNNVKHSHSLEEKGAHSHSVQTYRTTRYGAAGTWQYDLVATGGGPGYGATDPVGNHGHTVGEVWNLPDGWVFPTEATSMTHWHTVKKNTKANATQSHENMPPYYVLVYIMKL